MSPGQFASMFMLQYNDYESLVSSLLGRFRPVYYGPLPPKGSVRYRKYVRAYGSHPVDKAARIGRPLRWPMNLSEYP